MTSARLPIALLASLSAMAGGCSRTQVTVPSSAGVARNDSYTDLQAGWTLRIVVPLLKSGGFRSDLVPQKGPGDAISYSVSDLIGYTTFHYAVTGIPGQVRLNFVSAEESLEGKTVPLTGARRLPFELPRKMEHVRLIYLVRVSQSDHNMAIAGAKRLDALDTFTSRLKVDPRVCRSDSQIFCSWVPAGIAVRPETGKP